LMLWMGGWLSLVEQSLNFREVVFNNHLIFMEF
jgi:hypothetical protein